MFRPCRSCCDGTAVSVHADVHLLRGARCGAGVVGDGHREPRIPARRSIVPEDDAPGLEVGLREMLQRLGRALGCGDEPALGVAQGEDELAGIVVRVDGPDVLDRDDDGAAARHRDLEVAAELGRNVAHLRRQRTTHLHRHAPVADRARHVAGFADMDQFFHADGALQGAVDIGGAGLHVAEAAAALVDDQLFGGDLAIDVAEDLELAAVADAALQDRAVGDDQDPFACVHARPPDY